MPPLQEARESLTYWERRAQTLPRYAIRQRREARAMAARWRERVSDAERARYGGGVLGAVLQFCFERRLPVAHQTGRQVRRAVTAAAVFSFAFCVAAGVVAIEIVRVVF